VLQTKVGSAPVTDYLYGLNRLASLNSGVKTWYAADALGSVRRTVADAGVPLGVINYDPWGTPETGTVPAFGFTGELQDAATGLVNLRARWYATGQGRFVARDPFAGVMEHPQTLAPYPYAENNPVNRIDPAGNLAFFVAGGFQNNDPSRFGDAGVWHMARRFAPIINGETIITNPEALPLIVQKIKEVHKDTAVCGPDDRYHEPIILVGHSRGAGVVIDAARQLERENSSIRIDLIVTLGLIPFSRNINYDRSITQAAYYGTKPSNVAQQINIMSELRSWSDPKLPPERHVIGAEEVVIRGSYHTTLDNEFLDVDRTKRTLPNPAWAIIEVAIHRAQHEVEKAFG